MDDHVLAVDLGGTNLRMAVVARDGSVTHRERCETPRGRPTDVVNAIHNLAQRCLKAIGSDRSIRRLGVAIPAILNTTYGSIERFPNLPQLNGFPLLDELKTNVELGILIENDATSAAIGEHWLGAARKFDSVICITLGTGVGGGLVLNGDVYRGPDGSAGEIGHICVEPEGHPCGCGSQGCLEQYSSATAVVRIARELSSKIPGSVLELQSGVTAQDVYKAALEGDEAAVRTFEQMGYYLGIALAGLINVLNPEVIVLGGGMSAAWDAFIEVVRGQIEKRAFRGPAVRVKLVRAELGDDAGILGVASLALAASDQGF